MSDIPEWAVDIRYRNRSFVFTDGVRKTQFLDGERCDSSKVKNWTVVKRIRFIAD
jgi:hypothetical protein